VQLFPQSPARRVAAIAQVRRACAVLAGAVAAAGLVACAGGGAGSGAGPDALGAIRTPIGPGTRGYPFAASRTKTQDYFGVAVNDDFQWLENAADPYTRSWAAAENAYSRRYLDAMPARAALHERLQALIGSTTNVYTGLVERGGLVFALKSAPPLQQPVLVVLKSADDLGSERVVFDPNEAGSHGTLAIDFFRPSLDGRRVAIAVSEAGSADGTLRVVDVATGQPLPDQLARVSTAGGGDVAWGVGSAGLFYTQTAAPGTRTPADARLFQQVFFHKLGTPPAQDRAELGAGFTRIARSRLESSRDGRTVIAIVANGEGGERSVYLKTADANGDGAWRRIASEADGLRDAQLGDDDALYVVSTAGSPRGKVLRMPLADTRSVSWDKASVIAPQSDGAVDHFVVAGGTLYVADLVGGPSRLRAIDVRTKRATTLALPPATGIAALARIGRSDVVVQVSSYIAPPLWMHVGGGRIRRTALVATSDADFNDSEVLRDFVVSRDGTQVPLNILRRKSTRLDGHNPVLLTAYGAGGVSLGPAFDPARRVWLDRGGIVVIANVRGGGEFGETWHRDGNGTKKQNAIDDFIGAADALVQRGYTRPALLGATGRGPGALLVGAALVQRPELFRAASASSGPYDMLRAELDPGGAVDTPEFGSVKERAQFEALYAYSPLRNVRDGASYPAVLVMAGDADARVNPAQSRKMVARLQQGNPSGRVILLRTANSSGRDGDLRGMSLSERIEQASDEYGFLVHELMAGQ
jgi:prolyl oligopeptidase